VGGGKGLTLGGYVRDDGNKVGGKVNRELEGIVAGKDDGEYVGIAMFCILGLRLICLEGNALGALEGIVENMKLGFCVESREGTEVGFDDTDVDGNVCGMDGELDGSRVYPGWLP